MGWNAILAGMLLLRLVGDWNAIFGYAVGWSPTLAGMLYWMRWVIGMMFWFMTRSGMLSFLPTYDLGFYGWMLLWIARRGGMPLWLE